MELLLLLGLIFFLVHKASKSSKAQNNTDTIESRLNRRNQEWTSFIESYEIIAKGKAEHGLLKRILSDIKAQGLTGDVSASNSNTAHDRLTQESQFDTAIEGEAEQIHALATVVTKPKSAVAPPVQLDNASLLLYFGAFLFVASVGLFISFSGTTDIVKTFAVLFVMVVLYGGGIWLFQNRPKLRQAGVAFAGMGMAIAPLFGTAIYYYLFSQTNGPAVWMFTSVLCMAMYTHALIKLHHPLISYILIFTFVSLFESGVSIIQAPIYYFGWGLALTGIILELVSRMKGYWPELQESSRMSSQVLLPLSIFASLVVIGRHGTLQFGVSLLFAAAYYGLRVLSTSDMEQQSNAVVAQIAAIGAVATIVFSWADSWSVVASTVLAINALQLMVIAFLPSKEILSRNFASVLLASGFVGVILGIHSDSTLVSATILLLLVGIGTWLKQQRIDAYIIACLAWLSLPLLVGQVLLKPALSGSLQAVAVLAAFLVQTGLYLGYKSHNRLEGWHAIAQQTLVFAGAVTVITAVFAPAWVCLGIVAVLTAVFLLLSELESDSDWAVVGGLLMTVPIGRAWTASDITLVATSAALLVNIYIALRHRNEITRWMGTMLWLLLPVVISRNVAEWTPTYFAWTYLVTMAGLLFARAIARGIIFVSAKVPLTSYARTASYSYVFGYCTAAFLSLGFAFSADNSRWHATSILLVLATVTILISRVIEKRSDILVLVPIIVQAALLSGVRPVAVHSEIYLLLSSLLAVALYFILPNRKHTEETSAKDGALVTAFIAPFAYIFVQQTLWPMPLGLLIAGAIVYHRVRSTSQANRELAASIFVASLLWFMAYLGVQNLQAYSHIIAAMFAAYAYLRHIRGERKQSDQYLFTMLGTATVPLVVQAVGGQAGGLYGWWLLLEQVGFMLLGMVIGRRKVTFWGLYVAIAAVLYQLRNLGWAALTVLAMFLIGIAIYYLQKHGEDNSKN